MEVEVLVVVDTVEVESTVIVVFTVLEDREWKYRCENGAWAENVSVYRSWDNKAKLEPWSETAAQLEHWENVKPRVTGNNHIHVHTSDAWGQNLKVIFNPYSHPCSWSV